MNHTRRCELPQGCDDNARWTVSVTEPRHPLRVFGAEQRVLCDRHYRVFLLLAERYDAGVFALPMVGPGELLPGRLAHLPRSVPS